MNSQTENRTAGEHELSYSERARARREEERRQQKKRDIIIIAILLAVLVVGVSVVFILTSRNPGQSNATRGTRHDVSVISGGGKDVAAVTGTWYYDTVTIYSFDGKGRGSMSTAVGSYPFSYSAQDGVLDIDFDTDRAEDGEYTYTVSPGTLIMTRNGIVYEFHTKSSESTAASAPSTAANPS